MRLLLAAFGRALIDLAVLEPPDDEDDDPEPAGVVSLGFTTQIVEEAWPGEYGDDEDRARRRQGQAARPRRRPRR